MASKTAKQGTIGGAWIPATCSIADLAVMLGVSTRTVRDLDQNGTIVRAPGRGRFETTASINGYLKRLREQAAGRASQNGVSLADERAQTERISRQIQEIKLAEMRGEVLTLDEISASWSSFASAVKSGVLSIPGRARSTIPHLTAHDAAVLKQICRDVLQEMAEEVDVSVISGDSKEIQDGQ